MAHLINFYFEFFYEIFTNDASLLLLLYNGAKKSKMTKNSNQGVLPYKVILQGAQDIELVNYES